MIDILYILVLLLSEVLLIAQELTIRSQNKLLALQNKVIKECEPIIAAVANAIEQAKTNGNGEAKVELPEE